MQNSALRNSERIYSYFQSSFIVLGKQSTFLITWSAGCIANQGRTSSLKVTIVTQTGPGTHQALRNYTLTCPQTKLLKTIRKKPQY